jgi:probable HAF family extracellular repeat protein
VYSGGGFTSFDEPLTTDGTYPTAINDAGQVVGYYIDSSGFHGFLYSGGAFTTIDDPSTQYTEAYTIPTGINDLGQIVGY